MPSAAKTNHYQFSQSRKTWQDAQDYCSAKFDNLVEFNEPGQVEAALVDAAVSLGFHGEAWIGLKKGILDWTWVNGEPLLMDNWKKKSDSSGENCALMYKSGTWKAAECSVNSNVICEGE